MYVITSACDRCGFCLLECALDAIEPGQSVHRIVQERCTRCGACHEVCPIDAIDRVPEEAASGA